jgi:hypothetical protein
LRQKSAYPQSAVFKYPICDYPTKHLLLILYLLLLLTAAPLRAQVEPDGSGLVYGATVTGQINNNAPRVTHFFDALRCDFVSVNVRATGGNLDPIVTILDDTGKAIFARDDSRGGTDIHFEPLPMPHSGRYYVVVGRFGYGLGSTAGSYELTIDRIGNGSASGCAMRYGDTVTNTITNMEPQIYYSFRARQGDIVDVSMRRLTGDLDAYLQIVDSTNFVLDYNDDVPGSGTQDAAIQSLVLPQDGTYYVVATRYGLTAGTTTGTFVLTLNEADGSGLGISPMTALTIQPGQTVEGSLTPTLHTQYYRFDAQQNDLITVRMERASGDLDPFLAIASPGLQEIVSDDDSGGGQNAMISDFRIPSNGTYYIVATRFERAAGTTRGNYRLSLVNRGSAFADVPEDVRRISYGFSVTGTVDLFTPDVWFAFWGNEGDIVSVSMNRSDGDLDPFVSILAADRQTVLASDDDSGGGQNALISGFTLPQTGVYYARATHAITDGGRITSGGFVLVVVQRFE